jgi:ComF family protein
MLRSAVLRLKRPREEFLNLALADLSCELHGAALRDFAPDVVAPIPMHWQRRLVRGVNSPELLAERWSDRLRVPLARRLLVRQRNTPPQADLPPGKRFSNLRHAFRAGATYNFRGVKVLLLDDIMTTGATCHEAAKTLRSAGASDVAVVVLARAGDA